MWLCCVSSPPPQCQWPGLKGAGPSRAGGAAAAPHLRHVAAAWAQHGAAADLKSASPGLQSWGPTAEGGLAQPGEEFAAETGVLLHPLSPGSAPIRLCHPQGDPGKRGRGEQEAKRLFIFEMFYNGIISSQEVFQIDLVRKRFHFSSSEMRWESSLWCEPSQSSGNHRSEKLRARWTDTRGSPVPTHPQVPFAPSLAMCSMLASRAVPSLGRALPISTGGKTFLKKSPFSPRKTVLFWGI